MRKPIINRIWILFIALLLFAGCERDLDLSQLRPDPKLVVNSMIVDGLPVMVHISRTWFIQDERKNILISDAEVKLYVNGQLRETLPWIETEEIYEEESLKGVYLSTYIPHAGDQIYIKVKAKDFPDAEAETLIPELIPIKKLDFETTRIEGNMYDTRNHIFKITFQDNPSKSDYYFLMLESGYPVYDYDTGVFQGKYKWYTLSYINYDIEPVFSHETTALDRILGYDGYYGYGRVFTDELINGKEYTLQLEASTSHAAYYYSPGSLESLPIPEEQRHPIKVRASLYSLSEPLFFYLRSIIDITEGKLINDLISIGLAEPYRIYNNVSGGVGILGGCSGSIVTIDLD